MGSTGSADFVVSHNGQSFDCCKINARCLDHGLPPPSPYTVIDTLRIARRVFGFNSNKPDELSRQLSLGRKMDNGGIALWAGCMSGDKATWKTLKDYNRGDVELLENSISKFVPGTLRTPTSISVGLGFVLAAGVEI
jgi:uncharacterized protein YprB with RNaseH-like and TPR domain